jgi:hypothetical protein
MWMSQITTQGTFTPEQVQQHGSQFGNQSFWAGMLNGSIDFNTSYSETTYTDDVGTHDLSTPYNVNIYGGAAFMGNPQEPAKPSHDRGSRIRPQEVVSQLTGAQCAALRKLLSREAELGTTEAAARSQISYPYPKNDRLMNDFNSSANPNIVLDDGTQIDLDWWTTLAGVSLPDASILSVHNTYVLAKTTWSIAKRTTTGNPVPYQDPGERWAVLYTAAHQSFGGVFDEKFMNRECGPNSRHR